MNPLINKEGITVKELKELIKDLPEVDQNGDPYEVWIENTDDCGKSNVAQSVFKLNQGDIIISISI